MSTHPHTYYEHEMILPGFIGGRGVSMSTHPHTYYEHEMILPGFIGGRASPCLPTHTRTMSMR